MKKSILTLSTLLVLTGSLLAQNFLTPVWTFSHKKTAYITLKDGTTVEGTIKDLDRKKGTIEEVKLKDSDGKSIKLKPEDINFMYLPQSGASKLSNSLGFLTDATKWDNEDLDQELFGRGYVYIESSSVMIKKKRMDLLMQLLNPHFSGKIKVYADPWAGETMSLGIGPVDMVGGLAKSYYVKKAKAKAAVKLKKKDYDNEFQGFYSSCKTVAKMSPKWADFVSHVHTFATACN